MATLTGPFATRTDDDWAKDLRTLKEYADNKRYLAWQRWNESWRIYNNQYDLFTYGAGYLDVDQALASNDVATGAALSPTASYNPLNRTISIQNTGSSTLATSVI